LLCQLVSFRVGVDRGDDFDSVVVNVRRDRVCRPGRALAAQTDVD
jgi:hypothetical protein